MEHFLRKIWVVLLAFTVFGILSWVPVDKYQKVYLDEFHRIKAKPQKRVDYAYKYVEYIEEGGDPNSRQSIMPDFREKQIARRNLNPRYRKPYYIRDKYNRNILRPYRG